ncbi:MAG: ATP synthase F0 subunit B [Acidobacteriota bacterium]
MNRHRNLIFLVLIVLLSISLFGEDGHGHHFDWAGFLGKVLNSSILFGGLILIARKPLIKFLSEKSIDVKNDIEVRESDLNERLDSLKGIKDRLTKIEAEVNSMVDLAKKSGEEEKQRIEDLGKLEAERILKNTEDEIDARVEVSVRALKEKIADLSIEKFREDFSSGLDENLHKKIVEKNIEIAGDIIERT